jgi:3-hydroxybutyrate dehydrogenase
LGMLTGKNAIVTGSTSGIGKGIAEALAGAGANVMLNGFGDAAEIEKQRAALAAKAKVEIAFHGADMSKPAEIRDLVAAAQAKFGGVDILVNNAGIQFVAPIDQFPDDRWDSIIAINLSSAFHATRAALPGMKKRGWGRVINVASIHGLVASPYKSAYVAAKHGVVGFTKTVALEVAKDNISVNAICACGIDAPGDVFHQWMEKEGITAEAAGKLFPIGRMGRADELTEAVLFLSSEQARFVVGHLLVVDGGWIAR